jgi:hypothetical protein
MLQRCVGTLMPVLRDDRVVFLRLSSDKEDDKVKEGDASSASEEEEDKDVKSAFKAAKSKDKEGSKDKSKDKDAGEKKPGKGVWEGRSYRGEEWTADALTTWGQCSLPSVRVA